jgi:tetratricopeptide (TPR) repeat protein
MRIVTVFAVSLPLLTPAAGVGQSVWVGHQPPCELSIGHYLVRGSVVHLKLAVESRFPDEHDNRLVEARKVLHEAILERGQADNPAAWYYLGRAYTESADGVGADSAFRRAVALAPACAQDAQKYRTRLAALSLNEALRTWGAGQRDSALTYFRRARGLDSTDAEFPLYTSIMFASEKQPDSAARYLDLGLAAAATDTGHEARLKQAALEVARAYEARAYEEVPATQTVAQTRAQRDSTSRVIPQDSTLFARVLAAGADVRARGRQMSPTARAAFERDSTILATRLTQGRRSLDSLRRRARDDSIAVTAALAPALQYYERYVARYPADADAAIQLVRLHGAAGNRPALDSLVTQVAASPHPSISALAQAGLSLYNDGLAASAALLLESALRRNPNDHSALAVLTHVYHAEGRKDDLMRVARLRIALEPLDPSAARAMALAWDLQGTRDSVRRWVAAADTGLGWHVRVSQYQGGEAFTSISGSVANATARPLPALALVFEFLDQAGQALFNERVSVPALDPQGRAPFTVRVERGGAASWRYRRE